MAADLGSGIRRGEIVGGGPRGRLGYSAGYRVRLLATGLPSTMRPVNRLVALLVAVFAVLSSFVALAEDQSSEIAVRMQRGKELSPPSYMKRSQLLADPRTYRILLVPEVHRVWGYRAEAPEVDERTLRVRFLRQLIPSL
ncbi:hypothetical protein QR680_012919 [Steinernema hermaphroditum]|uniref:Uncharacterized protein n=1 Tax=Steinernema hermaphroditum TaxID=289476 RepID=A0AA39M1L9_9BILA|nr:hypothetical protein QR680_012919 [Steinernema hermaphroditum]